MAKLKCWIGNYDGQRRALVIATSQAQACEILGMSLHGFRPYFSDQGEVPTDLKPFTMYTKDNTQVGNRFTGWIEGRCELNRKGRS